VGRWFRGGCSWCLRLVRRLSLFGSKLFGVLIIEIQIQGWGILLPSTTLHFFTKDGVFVGASLASLASSLRPTFVLKKPVSTLQWHRFGVEFSASSRHYSMRRKFSWR
jgi:hypothetical protein